jgi:hypothetical protein
MMMKHVNHERLRQLRLYGMAKGLEALERLPDRGQLAFDEQLGTLIERQAAERANTALASRLKRARLRQTACLEDLDLRTPRGLDRGVVRELATGRWVKENRPVLITGPTGIGKTWLACTLGNQAAREGHSVLYTRLTRLLDDLATARLDGSLAWTRDIADQRCHGTTGEAPILRFQREEAQALKPLAGIPPFTTARDLVRRVGADCAVEVDGNAYSVPWRLIGERVRVMVEAGTLRVLHAGREVAAHAELKGRHGRSMQDAHLAGVAGADGRPVRAARPEDSGAAAPTLLRPLAEYEAVAGGGF